MRTILVVDDDPWVRVLARDVLAGEGYRVLEASDGQDAILRLGRVLARVAQRIQST